MAADYRPADCAEAVTSGSTGQPLKFYIDKRSLAFRFGLNLRTLEFSAYRVGRKLLQVSPPLSGKLESGPKTKLIDVLLRRLTVPPFDPDMVGKFRQMVDFRPEAIVGYTSYIKSLADLAQEAPLAFAIPSIMTTSEQLLPQTRKKLGDIFGGRVFDQYGSVETGRAATECVAGSGYHVNVEGVFIEVVTADGRDAPPGEMGEMIVTNLMNYAHPFIRYRVGDFAASAPAKACSCGRELPLLERIGGRLNDIIVLPGGRRVMPEYFYLSLRDIGGLGQFQIIQTAPTALRVLYAKEGLFDEAKRAAVEAEYRRYLRGLRITWEPVKDIAAISGKHRHIVSLRDTTLTTPSETR